MESPDHIQDVAIIGGGPAGSVAAICCARLGLSVLLLEKQAHPRFHIGESMLPRGIDLINELGLADRLKSFPQTRKYGAGFVMADTQDPTLFWFSSTRGGKPSQAVNIERSTFDRMLLDAAQDEGCDVREGISVEHIDRLEEGDVSLATSAGQVRARILLDASGQATLVARHLRTRHRIPGMARVAHYAHFAGVERALGHAAGSPINVMGEEGWFWVIPLDSKRTSVGLVLEPGIANAVGVSADTMLRWGVERSPYMRRVMRDARGPIHNIVCADYSYRCDPFAGPGYMLLGDAAMFIDPIFSAGVCMAMETGRRAAGLVAELKSNPKRAMHARREYINFLESSSRPLFNLVQQYYTHPFRELMLTSPGPLGIHDAVLSVLAGYVFPRPRLSVRLRLAIMNVLVKVHARTGKLAPSIDKYSLLNSTTAPAEEIRKLTGAIL